LKQHNHLSRAALRHLLDKHSQLIKRRGNLIDPVCHLMMAQSDEADKSGPYSPPQRAELLFHSS
jgi:hypothetical protein